MLCDPDKALLPLVYGDQSHKFSNVLNQRVDSVDDLKVRDETVFGGQECYNILVIPEFRRLSWEC